MHECGSFPFNVIEAWDCLQSTDPQTTHRTICCLPNGLELVYSHFKLQVAWMGGQKLLFEIPFLT